MAARNKAHALPAVATSRNRADSSIWGERTGDDKAAEQQRDDADRDVARPANGGKVRRRRYGLCCRVTADHGRDDRHDQGHSKDEVQPQRRQVIRRNADLMPDYPQAKALISDAGVGQHLVDKSAVAEGEMVAGQPRSEDEFGQAGGRLVGDRASGRRRPTAQCSPEPGNDHGRPAEPSARAEPCHAGKLVAEPANGSGSSGLGFEHQR